MEVFSMWRKSLCFLSSLMLAQMDFMKMSIVFIFPLPMVNYFKSVYSGNHKEGDR